MNETEKMPEANIINYYDDTNTIVLDNDYYQELLSFCTQQAEKINHLTEASKKRSEYNRSLLSCINDWAEKYEKLEEEKSKAVRYLKHVWCRVRPITIPFHKEITEFLSTQEKG